MPEPSSITFSDIRAIAGRRIWSLILPAAAVFAVSAVGRLASTLILMRFVRQEPSGRPAAVEAEGAT